MDVLDGIIGVVLGLYISSHPAASLVDILFYRRAIRYQIPSKRSLVLWLSLNVLVLFISGIVIFVGTTRLIGSGE
jgi:Tfp pilus assembly ATPase PilU